MCYHLPSVTTYPKHQNFPSQSLTVGTFIKRPRPVSDRDFLLFWTSCKRPNDALPDLYVRCVQCSNYNRRSILVTTWTYTWRNLESVCNKLSSIKWMAWTSSWKRRPVVRFLLLKRLLSLCILGGRLREVRVCSKINYSSILACTYRSDKSSEERNDFVSKSAGSYNGNFSLCE